MTDALAGPPATRLAELVRTGQASAREVVQAHIDRIEARNTEVNAVIARCDDRALAEAAAVDAAAARGEGLPPLAGVPFTVKDTFDTDGVPTTWGTAGRAGHVPGSDATVVARLRSAGAILVGKTNLPELAMSYETDNALFGATRNPFDLGRDPGGSSGGSAAALAAGMTALEVGSDTAGSIRIPAHFCGVCGIKPTAGRVPHTGSAGFPGSHVSAATQVGPMARTVDDLTAALRVLSGPDGADPAAAPVPLGDPADVDLAALTVAVVADNGIDPPTEATRVALRAASDALADRGAGVEPAEIPDLGQAPDLLSRIIVGDGGMWIARGLEHLGTATSTFGSFPLREPLSSPDYVELLEHWDHFRARLLRTMGTYDLLVMPVTAQAAPPLGAAGVAARPAGYTYTHAFNLTGQPVAVVRCGWDGPLPIGLQIVAAPWRDDVALAAAGALEAALGGFVPPAVAWA